MYSKFLNLILFISISIWFVLADQDDNKEKDAAFEKVIILVDNVLDFSRPVALFEFANNHPIDHPDKEAAFLERVNAKAVEIKLDTEFARLFFADQINASKVVQSAYFALWNRTGLPNETVVDIHTTEFQSNMGKVTMDLETALLPIVKYRDEFKCPKETRKIVKELAKKKKIDISCEFNRDKAFVFALRHLCSNRIFYN
uniref:Chorismate mutase domain-containing protein n=1 Tax=Meloidogyne enterolobii TaxID=390850 RepID=A0A6V7X3S6_MELEN|nr:unnamed protein product [Meloidogyne enterolobii]